MKNLVVVVLLLWVLLVLNALAQATTYYASPTGGGSTCSLVSPCALGPTFIAKAAAGDTLVLLNGTYTESNSTFPSINCNSGANNGTSAQHITITAQTERQAFLNGNGSANMFEMDNCHYWDIVGLRIKSTDFNAQTGETFLLRTSSYITVRRMLISHDNRYVNASLIFLGNTTDSLIEENELYYFHRHGISLYYSNSNVIRRNYINSRGYQDYGYPNCPSTPAYCSATPDRGEAAINIYPGSNNIAENNISEGNLSLLNIEAFDTSMGNQGFGNMSIGDVGPLLARARGSDLNYMPQNTYVENMVAINAGTSYGQSVYGDSFWLRAAKNAVCDHCTFLNSTESGLWADTEVGQPGDGAPSLTITNSIFAGAQDAVHGGYGLVIGAEWTKTVDHIITYQNLTNYSGVTPTNSYTSTNPGLGACYLWVPDGAFAKAKGTSSSDIGATVLYKYQNGKITSNKLWNTDGSATFAGATIAGINDNASGFGLVNVASRLHIGAANGCTFPASYANPLTIVINGPTSNPTYSTSQATITLSGTSNLP